jgi:DNA adenine methylase
MNLFNFKSINPVIKWAGGKRQVIQDLLTSMPKSYNRYFEPFIGAGALFLEIQPKDAVINDLNFEIYNLYKVLSNLEKTEKLITKLGKYQKKHNDLPNLESKSKYYYSVRELDKEADFKQLRDYEILARTIYLNKSCFNGLFRLNSSGYFNVPFGKKEKVKLFEKTNLIDLNNYLSSHNISIFNEDFEINLERVKPGDFVYLDPPYDVIKNKKSFTQYSKEDFGKEDQKRLAKVFNKLSEKGVLLMLSNHNTPLIRKLYKKFNVKIIEANRMINSKGNKRGPVEEVIITNYEITK